MPLNYILGKCTGQYKLTNSQEKMKHLINMDDIKLLAKNERELETLIQAWTSLGFWDTNGSLNLDQTTRPCNNQKKKKMRTCRIVDLGVPADHKVKLKESEKKDKYLDLAWELKKTVEYESEYDTNFNWCSWYSHQSVGTGTGGIGNKRARLFKL